MVRRPPYVPRRAVPAHRRGAALAGVLTFPTQPLNRLVEIALGADLTADPGTWVYTDVSNLVRERDPIAITVGRADEASRPEPTQITLTVDNTDGRWTRTNPMGIWFGQIGIDTPIRISADPGTGAIIQGEGFISSLPPRWDISGNDHWAPITAAGILQRIGIGNSPTRSAMTRETLALGPLESWPAEDPVGSTTLASAVGGTAMALHGTVTLASDTTLVGSGPLPVFTAGAFATGTVRPYTNTGAWTGIFDVKVPSAPATVTPLADWRSAGTITRWRIELNPATTPDRITLRGYGGAGEVFNASFDFTDTSGVELYGQHISIALEVLQSGADINYQISASEQGFTFATGTVSTQAVGALAGVTLNPGGTGAGITLGQASAYDATSLNSALIYAPLWAAMDGVPAAPANRILDLCTAAGVPIAFPYPRTADVSSVGDRMGPQPVGTVVALLQEAEDAGDGVLSEHNHGLAYRTREARYNAPADMTLDYAQGHLTELVPADDQQRLRNDVTVSRSGGGSARATVDAETLRRQGTYDTTITLNLETDTLLPDQAGWRLHLATNLDTRYPRLVLNLAGTPSLIAAWSRCTVGSRVTVDNPPADLPPDPVDVLIEGYRLTLGPYTWLVEANCSAARLYEVFTIGDPRLGRLDTEGSQLGAGIASGAVSLSVATTDGPLWTTDAGDMPMDIGIGGEQITVTAVSGATSPQTFTCTRSVNGVVKSHDIGAAVNIWRPGVIAL